MTDTIVTVKEQTVCPTCATTGHLGLRPRFSLFVKRLVDVFVAFWGLVFLSPFFLVIAGMIKRESPGPVFYRGPRMGRNGKPFGILKFRTMWEERAGYLMVPVTACDDPRITPLGSWLRHTKVNELPQLWNVLVGEMSLVGPRPEDPGIVATWPEDARCEILSRAARHHQSCHGCLPRRGEASGGCQRHGGVY